MSLADDFDAMRRTIWGEARGEPFQGQLAVGHVILNRAHHPTIKRWGIGIYAVCHAKDQFSCWNPADPNSGMVRVVSENMPSFIRASAAAGLVLSGEAPDPTGHSTHYYRIGSPEPNWVRGAKHTVDIGHHAFFTDVP